MILVKNFYDKNTFITISDDGCSVIPSGKLNCSTRGTGAFLESGDLVTVFVHSGRIYFQYNESIYPLDEYVFKVSNIAGEPGTRTFTFTINDETVCCIVYSEYISSSYYPHNIRTDDFLMYITEILEDRYSIQKYINEIETLNTYYGT